MFHPDTTVPNDEGKSGGSPFDRIMLLDHNGQECWSARDLQSLCGYSKWQEFEKVLAKAQLAISNSGFNPHDHFTGARKVIMGGRWGRQEVNDFRLTRFAAYQVALAGDASKREIAAAKTYFAVKAREAELAQQPTADVSTPEGILALAEKYVEAARELVSTKRELAVAKPKANKWDAFCNDEGLIELGVAAKLFSSITGGLGRTKFMERLRDEDIHFLQVQNPRIPYEVHIQAGRAQVKVVPANYKMVEQTFLTHKGMDWLADKFGVGDMLPAA